MSRNCVDCNYTKTKFAVFEERSTKHSNIVTGDHRISCWGKLQILGLTFRHKIEFCNTYRKNCLKASAKLWHIVQTEGNTKQMPISAVFSILCITDSS